LRELLAAELPAFMVPSAVIPVTAFPLTPNGKVDRAALPEPETGDFAEPASAPLQTETEFAVADLWREVLDTEVTGASDNFFSLGGHSLLAARVISRINAQMGVNLTIRAIFESPTVAALAAAIDQARADGGPDVSGPVLRRLDRAQQRVGLAAAADGADLPRTQ
jgi:acyl carrier protein